MSTGASRQLVRVFAAFALLAFAGDLIADSLADVHGDHCVSESSQSDSHEKGPCSHCSCAVHNGSAITSSGVVTVVDRFDASLCVLPADQSIPAGVRAAIDHPPQLA